MKTICEDELCPDCGAFRSFLEGPCGGMSMNIMCEKCETKFNIAPGFFIERI